eukprot:996004-Amphidinium_carterae.1
MPQLCHSLEKAARARTLRVLQAQKALHLQGIDSAPPASATSTSEPNLFDGSLWDYSSGNEDFCWIFVSA